MVVALSHTTHTTHVTYDMLSPIPVHSYIAKRRASCIAASLRLQLRRRRSCNRAHMQIQSNHGIGVRIQLQSTHGGEKNWNSGSQVAGCRLHLLSFVFSLLS